MIRADTHIHSIFSDGTYTPEQIVSIAKQEGLSLIALTDHNILEGNKRFAECARQNGVNAIAGVEITTGYPGREIHLLSYFPIDADFSEPGYRELTDTLSAIRERKVVSNKTTLGNLSADYPQVSYEGFLESASRSGKECSNFNRMNIAAYLTEIGLIEEPTEGFNDLLSKDGKYYKPSKKEDLLKMVRIVKDCGGFPVVAHLGEYEEDLTLENIEQMLNDISEVTKEFGVELFHYKHDDERRKTYLDICSRIDADIIFTAGSDCHGTRKPNRIGYPYEKEPSTEHMQLYEDVSRKAVEFFKNRFRN